MLGELARLLVVLRPFDRLAALRGALSGMFVGVAFAARPQRRQRALRALAAVDSRRPEEDHGVLDLLLFEAAERLEYSARMRIGRASPLSRNAWFKYANGCDI